MRGYRSACAVCSGSDVPRHHLLPANAQGPGQEGCFVIKNGCEPIGETQGTNKVQHSEQPGIMPHIEDSGSHHSLHQAVLHLYPAKAALTSQKADCNMHSPCNAHVFAQVLHSKRPHIDWSAGRWAGAGFIGKQNPADVVLQRDLSHSGQRADYLT
jgi:hypothetical protein